MINNKLKTELADGMLKFGLEKFRTATRKIQQELIIILQNHGFQNIDVEVVQASGYDIDATVSFDGQILAMRLQREGVDFSELLYTKNLSLPTRG